MGIHVRIVPLPNQQTRELTITIFQKHAVHMAECSDSNMETTDDIHARGSKVRPHHGAAGREGIDDSDDGEG